MSKPLLLLVALFFSITTVGQKKEAFSSLNLPPDELFLPLSNSKVEIADGCSITSESDVKTVGSWLGALSRSSHDETHKIPNYADVSLGVMSKKAADFVDRLVLVHKSYLDISDVSQLETDEYGVLYSASEYTNWTKEKTAFFLHSTAKSEVQHYQFILESDYFLSDEAIEMYTIDLHNAKGEQPLELNKVYMYNNGVTIHYNGATPLNYSIGRNKKNGASFSKTNGYIDPSPSPWPQLSPFYPWTQNAFFNGQNHLMNMYPLISEDGVFDDPILFFEGIDFGVGNSALGNGDFGWTEFITGGQGTPYAFLNNFPNLLDSLRGIGKDVVLIDFWDGATYIEDNTAAAKKAIKLCNEYKVGNHPLVCVGTSMGGVIARKALKEMELDANQEHCTSLFISQDAPHQGANIPIGLQALISFLSDPEAAAEQVQQLTLLRPAARQLLVRQYHPYTNWHQNFQASLDNLGYPEECTMIAVNNGSQEGLKINGVDSGQFLLDYNCDTGIFNNVLQLEVMALPGMSNHEDAISPGSVLAKFRLVKTLLDSGCNSPLCVWDHNFQVNTGQIPDWDNMPGGYRTSMAEFVHVVNQSLSLNENCSPIGIESFSPYHSFIPTFSALGMDVSYAFQNIREALIQDPSLSPFDAHYSPNNNEQHSALTQGGIDFLWPYILSSGTSLSGDVTANSSPNEGVFNYGKNGYNLVGDVALFDGGSLLINHNQYTHWSESSDNLVENQHFTVSSNPCSSHIRVGNGGLLHIGDVDSDHTGELILRSGSVLEIEENGVLIIDKNSTLKVEEGAEMHAYEDSRIILEEGAQLLIESGSAFYVNSPIIQLKAATAMIDLEGELVLEAMSTLELLPTDGEMGFVRFSQAGIRLWGSAARLKIKGIDNGQKLIEIAEDSQFWNSDDFNKVTIDTGLIEFKNGAQMPMSCSFTATDCTFKGTDANDNLGLHVFKRNNFYDCQFQNCSLSADLYFYSEAKLRVTDSYFTGNNTKVRVNGMGYSIVGCDFAGTRGIHSQDMTEPSVLFRSRLNGSDPFGGDFRGVFDDSDVELQIRKCGIHACGEYGVLKNRGMLTLNCTEITQNEVGVGVEWALLNMARGFGGGDNVLSNNQTNLLLNFALGVNINYGYNEFSDPLFMNIEGSVMGTCGLNCSDGGLFACANNTWLIDDQEVGPVPEYNTLYRVDECDGIGTAELCPASFFSFSQFSPPTCPNRRFGNPWKMASELQATNGQSIYKDYVYKISKASALLTINNSEGSDEDVIIELASLVESGVFDSMDEEDRYWSLVLKQTMKTALETANEVQQSQGAFTNLESRYVDVLNYFDDHYQTWSKVDYRLVHEQTKSSFFHSRGDDTSSRTILEKSGECGLSEKLNDIHHRIKCNLIEEITKKELGLHSIIANESILVDVQLDPIDNNPNNSQNCFISNAFDVQFGMCGTPPLLNAQLESVGIYPNPNEGSFKVILEDFSTCNEILIWNSLGQVIQRLNCTDQMVFNLDLELTKGVYIIEFRGENKSITEKLVIR